MVHRFEGEVGFGADLQHQRERHINLGGADFRAESDLDFWNWVYNDFREECQPPPPHNLQFPLGITWECSSKDAAFRCHLLYLIRCYGLLESLL